MRLVGSPDKLILNPWSVSRIASEMIRRILFLVVRRDHEPSSALVYEPRHHHAGHPERDDVAARHQHAGRVVVRQLRRLLGPAQRRMRPERGAEPGVEHVGFPPACAPAPQRLRADPASRADEPLPVLSSRCQATSSRPRNASFRSAARWRSARTRSESDVPTRVAG